MTDDFVSANHDEALRPYEQILDTARGSDGPPDSPYHAGGRCGSRV
jgi:hypothetical protein